MEEESNHTGTIANTASDLIKKCQEIQTSVQTFQAQAAAQHTPINASSYLKSLAAELKTLEHLSTASSSTPVSIVDGNEEQGSNLGHALRSSNLSFLQRVWDTAKRCRHVVGLSQRVVGRDGSKGSTIDVVAERGLLWVKVISIGERKLLFELAKEGDIWNDSDDEDDDRDVPDGQTDGAADEPFGESLSVVKSVKEVMISAQATKIRYKHPEVLIYFPRLQTSSPAVEKLLAAVRNTGATVHCGGGPIKLQSHDPIPGGSNAEMLSPEKPPLTDTINLDCTILLAIISDLSHLQLGEEDGYNAPLKRQLAAERLRPQLTAIIYPAFQGRKLVTSHLAAKRMREIVQTLATPSERRRAAIILGEGDFASSGSRQRDLVESLQKESVYKVPDLLLPIQIIDTDELFRTKNIPTGADLLNPILSDINQSVFILGWSEGITTVTSNRAAVKDIESVIRNAPGELIGPDVYLLEVSRSLVGKERVRRG